MDSCYLFLLTWAQRLRGSRPFAQQSQQPKVRKRTAWERVQFCFSMPWGAQAKKFKCILKTWWSAKC